MKKLLLFLFALNLVGCAEMELAGGPSYWSEMNEPEPFFGSRSAMNMASGDTGQTRISSEELQARTPASADVQNRMAYDMTLRQELIKKESALDRDELAFYNAHKDQLTSISDRIYYLDLTPNERRVYLSELGIIPSDVPHRTRSIASLAYGNLSYEKPITIGMSKSDVQHFWGMPSKVEYAGNPRFENERWAFWRNGNINFVYFESGVVSGWELE